MPKVFLSYSHADRKIAEALKRALAGLDVEVWWDDRVRPGDDWGRTVSDALAQSDAAVLLITPDSLRSSWARAEWREAIASTRRVLPVLAAGAEFHDLPPEVRHIQALRLTAHSPESPGSEMRALASFAASLTDASSAGPKRSTRRLDYLESPFADVRRSLLGAGESIDLATDSLEGLLRPVPTVVTEAGARGVPVRVVLPDPDYFSDVQGGRNLELAAKSRSAVSQLLQLSSPNLAIRLVARPVVQTMLRADDVWYVDPLPTSSTSHGFVRLTRGHAAAELFSALSNTFEAMFMSGRPSGPRPEWSVSTIEELLASSSARDLERAAQLYFAQLGYDVTPNARVGNAELDLLMWEPGRGGAAVVEVKSGSRPITSPTIDQLVSSARAVGATRAFLVTDQPLTASAFGRLREAHRPDLELIVVTPETMLASLGKASR